MINETVPLKGWDVVRVFRRVRTPADDMHIVPANDSRKHDLTWDCWCNPTIKEEYPPYQVLHKAHDKRELYEVDNPINIIPRA